MEYTINQLARLSGVTTRTLRHYDAVGLLKPARTTEAGYRMYGVAQVDILQQILFYKALGFALADIREALQDASFNREAALLQHMEALKHEKRRITRLIRTIEKTIAYEKGTLAMTDPEKFEGLKQRVADNERQYGQEARALYGDAAVDESNRKLLNLTQQQYESMQNTEKALMQLLQRAVQNGEQPTGETGKEIVRLHKEWLGYTWGSYSRERHIGLAQMYTADERFCAYYDKAADGATAFLCAAIQAFAE